MARESVQEDKPKAQNFFAGQKRKLKLDGWSPKYNNEKEKRVRIDFAMPLTGQPAVGQPEFIKNSFVSMEKEESREKLVELMGTVDNCSIEFYDQPSAKDECMIINGATLDSFAMKRVAEGESHVTILTFCTTVIRTMKLLKFLHEYERKDVWSQFEPTQAEITDNKQMRLAEQKAS
jgi:hypothetical protein